jgi:hypothetical protein
MSLKSALISSASRFRRAQLVHVDATIQLLDPSVDIDAILNKRTIKHVRLFRQGELGRLILDALRNAEGKPLSSPAIVLHIVAVKDIDKGARRTIVQRVRNLGYLERCGKIARTGRGVTVRWNLI